MHSPEQLGARQWTAYKSLVDGSSLKGERGKKVQNKCVLARNKILSYRRETALQDAL